MSDSIFDKAPKMNYREPAPPTDWKAFLDVVKSRRSVRIFKPEPIPEADLRACLEAALLAPNSSNLQPWEFHWVRSPERKAELVKACFSQPAAKTASDLIVCVARTGTWRANSKEMLRLLETQPDVPKSVKDYYAKLVPLAYGLGPMGILGPFKRAMFTLVGLFRPVPREPVSRSELKIWAVKTAALGCENLMLALRAHGYDSCPMEGMDSKRVRRLLRLPSDAVVVMVIGAGKRADDGVYGPQIRFDSARFILES